MNHKSEGVANRIKIDYKFHVELIIDCKLITIFMWNR